MQWYWLQDVYPDDDQWNSVHERLVDRWKEIAPAAAGPVHFAWTTEDESGEELMTVAYLQETAEQAGLTGTAIAMEDVGWHARDERFVDLDEAEIRTLCKLYPWEWIVAEPFGPAPPRRDVLDRADLEDAAVEQGAPRRAVGAVPGPSEPAADLPRRRRAADLLHPQAAARPRGRQHEHRHARRRQRAPGGSTARRASSSRSCARCPTSAASTPYSAPGSSATSRRAWASARPPA